MLVLCYCIVAEDYWEGSEGGVQCGASDGDDVLGSEHKRFQGSTVGERARDCRGRPSDECQVWCGVCERASRGFLWRRETGWEASSFGVLQALHCLWFGPLEGARSLCLRCSCKCVFLICLICSWMGGTCWNHNVLSCVVCCLLFALILSLKQCFWFIEHD